MAGESREHRLGDLTVVPEERRAFYRETEIALTSREFDILAALAARPGWVLSAVQLAEDDDPTRYASPFAVNVHVSHLRSKLADVGARGLVVTVRGVGWKLQPTSSGVRGHPRCTGRAVCWTRKGAGSTQPGADSRRRPFRARHR